MFPWLLWNIWKSRNLFCFEHRSVDADTTVFKAQDESSVWLQINGFIPADAPAVVVEVSQKRSWEKPPLNTVKCNIGSAWSASNGKAGAAWILRNSEGRAMLHSRRSFVGIRSQLEADLTAMVWAAEALCDIKAKTVLMETSMLHWRGEFSPSMLHYTLQPLWRKLRRALDHLEINIITVIHKECNMVATSIATSALQSSMATVLCGGKWAYLATISYHKGNNMYCLMSLL
ncbi:hypothetical protein Rs2_36475 [Raphanus sativus]|nr:hypothetical protein Rs2_36475 [Raphanus sativus]